jgi:hypothetical protein
MAKALLVLILIAGAAFFIYKQTNLTDSKEMAKVDSVRDRFVVAVGKFTSAAGRAGAIGMDTTFDTESAAVQVLKLRDDLAKLRTTLTEERAIGKAAALAEKIDNFCRKNDIIPR